MRAIPGLTVISPADCAEVYKTLEACIGFEHPVYIRLTGAVSCPVVYTEDYEFMIGRAVWLRQPQKITIISAGTTVGHCMKAAATLEEDGINVGLLNMHTINIDEDAITAALSASDTIFVMEGYTRRRPWQRGRGSYRRTAGNRRPDFRHGIADRYVETGNYPFLLARNQLDAPGSRLLSVRKFPSRTIRPERTRATSRHPLSDDSARRYADRSRCRYPRPGMTSSPKRLIHPICPPGIPPTSAKSFTFSVMTAPAAMKL